MKVDVQLPNAHTKVDEKSHNVQMTLYSSHACVLIKNIFKLFKKLIAYFDIFC